MLEVLIFNPRFTLSWGFVLLGYHGLRVWAQRAHESLLDRPLVPPSGALKGVGFYTYYVENISLLAKRKLENAGLPLHKESGVS